MASRAFGGAASPGPAPRLRPVLLAAGAGGAFALLTWWIMTLEPRFALAATAVVVVLSAGMVAIIRLEEFLLFATVFNIPFASFGKWMFVRQAVTVAKGIAIGLAEILLFFGYLLWFCQVFVTRSRPLPRLCVVDALIGIAFLAQCIALLGAPDRELAFFDVVYNLKFYLIYFFVTHRVERRHLKLLIALLLVGLVVESPLAVYERLSGNVGIGRSKGNVTAIDFANQYEVPGLEQVRAEGTTRDSHTLGLYFAMLLPLAFAFAMMQGVRMRWRVLMTGLTLMGIGGLVVTFSRAGWFSFAAAVMVLLAVAVFSWKQGQALFMALLVAVLAGLAYPKIYEYAVMRVFQAPGEIMQERYDLNWTAVAIVKNNFFFGYGPGNFMEAMSDPTVPVYGADMLPVHNVFLYIAAESGILAALAYFAVIFVAMARAWRHRNHPDRLVRGVAVAIVAGLFANVLDGLTNPTWREAEPYTLLWIYVAIAVALPRIAGSPATPAAAPAPPQPARAP